MTDEAKPESRFARPVSSILIRKRGTADFVPALEVIAAEKAKKLGMSEDTPSTAMPIWQGPTGPDEAS